MKRILISISMVLALAFFAFAEAPAPQPVVKAKAPAVKTVTKTAPVVKAQPTQFEKTVTVLKVQLADIEAKKVVQKQTQTNIEKEQAVLNVKSDSLYVSAKTVLKAAYDKEVETITAQDQALKIAREKLDQEYQGALKAVDEAKGGK